MGAKIWEKIKKELVYYQEYDEQGEYTEQNYLVQGQDGATGRDSSNSCRGSCLQKDGISAFIELHFKVHLRLSGWSLGF